MNPLALYIAQAIVHGGSLADIRQRATVAFGVLTSAQWNAALQTARSQIRVQQALARAGPATPLSTVLFQERVGRGSELRVPVVLVMTDAFGIQQRIPLDVVVDADGTVGDVYSLAESAADVDYGDMQLDDVLIDVGSARE